MVLNILQDARKKKKIMEKAIKTNQINSAKGHQMAS